MRNVAVCSASNAALCVQKLQGRAVAVDWAVAKAAFEKGANGPPDTDHAEAAQAQPAAEPQPAGPAKQQAGLQKGAEVAADKAALKVSKKRLRQGQAAADTQPGGSPGEHSDADADADTAAASDAETDTPAEKAMKRQRGVAAAESDADADASVQEAVLRQLLGDSEVPPCR